MWLNVRIVKTGKLRTMMIGSDFGTLGFDRTNLEQEMKRARKDQWSTDKVKAPYVVLFTQAIHELPCPPSEQLVQSRFTFSRVRGASSSCSISLIHGLKA